MLSKTLNAFRWKFRPHSIEKSVHESLKLAFKQMTLESGEKSNNKFPQATNNVYVVTYR